MAQVLEFDCATGISTYRDMTPEEVLEHEERTRIAVAEEAARKDAEAAAEAARESARTKLAALGLTEAEVAALVK